MLSTLKTSLAVVAITAITFAVRAPAAADEAPERTTSDHADEPSAQPLDLRAPDLSKLYTPEQIGAFLARNARDDGGDEVEVEGTREPPPPVTPTIWAGIAAPFWALLHPTQAWRVFLPFPPDQMHGRQAKPDATNPDYWPQVSLR